MLPNLTHQTLPSDVLRQYQQPFSTPESRYATWVFARDLAGANDWYRWLWSRRERLVPIPALLLWGERDPGFDLAACQRWEQLFSTSEVQTFPDAGHLPREEVPDAVAAALQSFLDTNSETSTDSSGSTGGDLTRET